MKNIFFKIIVLSFIVLLLAQTKAFAQADTLLRVCSQYLTEPYISDGQQYKALLNGDEVAEFRSTFYGGTTYRIITCSGLSNGNIRFSSYDRNRNLLFNSEDHKLTPYWDFKFTNTIDCIIEAQLVNKSSGFAIMLIGFKPF